MAVFNGKRCIVMTGKGICKYTGCKCRRPQQCFLSVRFYEFYKRLIRKKLGKDSPLILDKEHVHFQVVSKRMMTGKKW